jgi:ribosomal protein S18 acetylase RimI-like enzyme
MTVQIVPIERRHIAAFREVVDAVARERCWLAMQEAPPLARIRRVVLDNLREGAPQFVATDDGRLVGWCDVRPKTYPSQRHSGVLGMGVAASHRGRGVGAALLRTTLDAATAWGITRVELVVRADNAAATSLYERHGVRRAADGTALEGVRFARSARCAELTADALKRRACNLADLANLTPSTVLRILQT